jgi:hypothetical protein
VKPREPYSKRPRLAQTKRGVSLQDRDRPISDELVSLDQVFDLLAPHPDFRVIHVRESPRSGRKYPRLGRLIKEMRARRYCAEFAGALMLLHFELDWREPRTLIMDLHWYLGEMRTGWTVFIHFLDLQGNLCFQGDYPLDGEAPDALGFTYSRRTVAIPPEVASGTYRVRLGAWAPSERRHLGLSRIKGFRRELPGAYHNAILLDEFAI